MSETKKRNVHLPEFPQEGLWDRNRRRSRGAERAERVLRIWLLELVLVLVFFPHHPFCLR